MILSALILKDVWLNSTCLHETIKGRQLSASTFLLLNNANPNM